MSAQDRATTILKLASRNSRPDDFNRPGHIFPLKYREGGVLKRPGHTEASVDLAVLAGLEPAAFMIMVDLMIFLKKVNYSSYLISFANYFSSI